MFSQKNQYFYFTKLKRYEKTNPNYCCCSPCIDVYLLQKRVHLHL